MDSADAIIKLSALGHDGRLQIFRLLVRRAPDEVAAGEVALALGVRGSTMSNQLTELERAGLIQSRRAGRSILYSADLDQAGALLGFLASDCCKGRPEVCAPVAGSLLRRQQDWVKADKEDASMDRKYNVLFLCTANSARSIFAEAIISRIARDRFVGYSAGSSPRGDIHPRAKALLENLNFDASQFRSKSWDEFAGPGAPELDFVFTVCDDAANEVCPVWPGQPMSAHWGIPDPAKAEGGESEIALAFSEAYRFLYNRIGAFTNLPIEGLDSLTLQKQLDDIGKSRPAAGDDSALSHTG